MQSIRNVINFVKTELEQITDEIVNKRQLFFTYTSESGVTYVFEEMPFSQKDFQVVIGDKKYSYGSIERITLNELEKIVTDITNGLREELLSLVDNMLKELCSKVEKYMQSEKEDDMSVEAKAEAAYEEFMLRHPELLYRNDIFGDSKRKERSDG